MKVQEIADEIHRELDQPTDLSVTAIAFWILGHVGDLNTWLNGSYALNAAGSEITPELEDNEKAILKAGYLVYYYRRKVRQNLDAASASIVLDVSSDGATIRTVNKNEISKTYNSVLKDCQTEFDNLLRTYNGNKVVFKHHIPVIDDN